MFKESMREMLKKVKGFGIGMSMLSDERGYYCPHCGHQAGACPRR